MIPVSTEYRRQLIAGNRNWVIKVDLTLADTTALTLTNEHIWDNGIVIDEGISSDSSFDIGSAIVGSLKVVIDNITGNFSQYDFYDANLVLWLGVEGDLNDQDEQRYYRKGFYVVDTPSYNGSLITLNCLDNMTWFDAPFEDVANITYPTTAGEIVAKICSHVGVTLGTPTFPNYTTQILAQPEQKLNCREVIQYIAQMCCCYCKINTAGELVLKWYNKNEIINLQDYDGGTFFTTTTPYSDGCDLDGGSFDPWNTGDSADGGTFEQLRDTAYLSQNFEIEVSTDSVIVTGCRVRNTTSKDDAYDELYVDPDIEEEYGRYVLVIENNPFIAASQAATIANIVGNILAGLPIRGFTATSLADFSYETGDMVTVIDFRGNKYYTWITNFSFTTNNSERFSCGVESVRKRREERFSGTVKTLAEANANAENILDEYDTAVKAMDTLAANAIGYYEYVVGGVMYRYNSASDNPSGSNPKFPNSSVVFKISGDGIFVATEFDPDGTPHYTNGYDANSGTAILNLIYAIGLNAKWITAGTISADRIAANSITAGKLNVGTLSAISANMGTITAGSIIGQSIHLQLGSSDLVDISNGRLKTQGTWIQLCQDLEDPDKRHLALGNDNSAYIDRASSYQRTLASKWIIEAAYNASQGSDRRLKKKIKTLDAELSKELIKRTRPISFYYKDDVDGTMHRGKTYGVVAQEIREVLDDLGEDDAYLEHSMYDKKDYRKVEYKEFIPHLINVVKSQQEEIDLLKEEIALLKKKAGE